VVSAALTNGKRSYVGGGWHAAAAAGTAAPRIGGAQEGRQSPAAKPEWAVSRRKAGRQRPADGQRTRDGTGGLTWPSRGSAGGWPAYVTREFPPLGNAGTDINLT